MTAAEINRRVSNQLRRQVWDQVYNQVNKFLSFCIENQINNIILLHDGWIDDNDTGYDLVSFVKDEVEKQCGYRPKIGIEMRRRIIE